MPGGEGPHRTAGGGVAVGSHHQIPRAHPAGLQGHLEADSSPHREEFHTVLPGEILHPGVKTQGGGGGGR